MRGELAVLAVFLVTQTFAGSALAEGGSPGVDLVPAAPRRVQSCTIAAHDSISMNFLCQTGRGLRQYWVARSTRFVSGKLNASFFDLTTGKPVIVTFHSAGRLAIADVVRF